MLASEEVRCRTSELHIAHDSTKLFRAFSCLFLSVSYLQKGKASWAMCFHLMSIDYKKTLPLFPTPLARMSLLASARDKWPDSYQKSSCPEMCRNLLTCLTLYSWYGTWVRWWLQKGSMSISVKLFFYCQSPAEREPHWPVRRKKCYFHCSDSSGCCRQDRLCSVDMEVCDLNTSSWCGSLRMQRASEESWQLHQNIF